MSQPALLQESPDFSLVLGGPLFQLFRRARLSGNTLELLHRRVLVISLVTWLPLLILSAFEGHAWGDALKIPFLKDLETHVRFLVALPVLIGAELLIHSRLRVVVQRFVTRRIVRTEDMPKFLSAMDSAMRVRNSLGVEVGLLILVWTVGQWIWRSQIAVGTASWYSTFDGQYSHLTAAGYWNLFVSVPIFQFILLRWYVRIGLWFWFLWRVSRLELSLISTHPDRAGGLAFVGKSSYAFAPILFAQGALLSGLIATRVLYGGVNLLSFKMEAAGMVCFFVFAVLGPLVMFTPQLAQAKRKGLGEYGLLATRYVQEFEEKWVRGHAATSGELLGSGDIQSLADLGNSYAVIREMRPVPFGLEDITRLAVATGAPLLPLGLTIFSLEDLLVKLFQIVF